MRKFNLLILLILLILFLSVTKSSSQTNVYMDPSTYYKSVGDTAFVVFKISNVTDLHSSSILVKFDNTLVKYLGAINGTFYPGGSFFGQQPSASYVKDSLFIDNAIMGQSSVSGSGTLFTLKFKALANGVCPVIIKSAELRTMDNNQIYCSTQNGVIMIGGITANLKVFLQGPFNTSTNLMNTSLNTAGYIPSNQPYNTTPWNYTGTESVDPGFFGLNTTIVDWVLVELRTGTSGSSLVSKKAGLLKSNGQIVDYRDPNTPIILDGVSAGNYYVVIRHRNHIGVMTSSAISLSQSSTLYDFSTGLDKYYGGDAKLIKTGYYGMYTGDANGNGFINAVDRNLVIVGTGLIGYINSDLNLSGFTNAVDRNLVIVNTGIITGIPN